MSDDDTCGTIKGNDEPCDYPAKYADGKCGIHSEVNGDTQGRPTTFTDERARQIIAAARQSKSKAGCARAAGIAKQTLAQWEDADYTFTDEHGEKRSFTDAFMRARAEGETRLVEGGLTDDGVDGQMARFLLSTSFDYIKAEKREIEHSGEVDGFEFTITNDADTDD